jgi:hypothetical protein
MKQFDVIKSEKGVALLVALMMLLVLTFIGLSAVSMSYYETKIAGNERVYNNAFYAADGGIENFRGRTSSGEFLYSVATSSSYQLTIGGSAANVTYRRSVRNEGGVDYAVFQVTSEGVAPSFPVNGRVVVEAIIEGAMMVTEGYN